MLIVVQQRNGLGLVEDLIVAVHFSEWQDQDHLKQAASNFPQHRNVGIDEQTGVYLLNNAMAKMEGKGIYQYKHDKLTLLYP